VYGADASAVWCADRDGRIAFRGASGTWSLQTDGNSATLWDVAARARDDVWATMEELGSMLHWDGAGWTRVAVPYSADYLQHLYAPSQQLLYVAADADVLRYDGATWSTESVGHSINAVTGTGADLLWVVGPYGQISHRDASGTWAPQSSGTQTTLEGVWAADATDVWAVGQLGLILRYDGAVWVPQVTPTSSWLRAVWGTSPTNVWAVGSGTILHYDGTAWTNQTVPVSTTLVDIWGTDSSHIWAVGSSGVVLFYDGSSWSVQSTSAGQAGLNAVNGADAGEAWIVGGQGLILQGQP
jgi:hypothetical protein